ncbi:hypothetical protein P7D22_08665 [Lichenihabitans sp. Uapishka_5]|uniref:hypothetical protein n=1 Tax=Lichenihabitans sp. Uapishka_5 TaxID=3037302 RepID=UPI0029E827BA|nr:hypothetical protein [Lichenihabitans sp. Uapishka_5]MDX7951248.1 hypothetical protein [Lichenihabitans sp. Uapishka_5]
MARILFVAQDKGGSGKSTAVRALAEAVPGIAIVEIDSTHRLIEFDAGRGKAPRQVQFFPMRASRVAIEASGGAAARAEFDPVIEAIAKASGPTVVDIGANTSASLLELVSDLAADLKGDGHILGVQVVVTSEPGAVAEVPRLLGLAKPWADALFLLENQKAGALDARQFAALGEGTTVSRFRAQAMEAKATEILQGRGLHDIPDLDYGALKTEFGLALASRIRADLLRFRMEAMEAVRDAATWLVS